MTSTPTSEPRAANALALGWLQALQALAAAASIIGFTKNVIDQGRLNADIDEILSRLHELRAELRDAVADILEAIDGIRRQFDERTANEAMALADRALYSDLLTVKDMSAAMGNSFEAAERLRRENNVVFAGPFIYVTNIRLVVLKAFDPNYFCHQPFQDEFRQHRRRLDGWITELRTAIDRMHRAGVAEWLVITPGGLEIAVGFIAQHRRDGVVVKEIRARGTSQTVYNRLEREINASRTAGVAADRRDFGVVDMERVLQAWEDAFRGAQRAGLVTQLLNRRATPADRTGRVVMIDGRMVADHTDGRAFLADLLRSREFLRRIDRAWQTMTTDGDDRLVKFAYQRLFGRDANADECRVLREMAAILGYQAFIMVLLYSDEYEKRYGDGLPVTAGTRIEPFRLPPQ